LLASSTISLGPLDEDDAVELTGKLFEQRGLDELKDRAESLASSSDGNPLFIEELTASLAERSTRDAAQLPGSIRGIVAARLDALPAPERAVVLDASVIGKVFWRGALEQLRPDRDHDLAALLSSLERRDFIRREGSSLIKGDQQFTFKHGLIREVAYLTLPREERRRCHEITAKYLEEVQLPAGDADATLAYHFREGGDTDNAIRRLLAAAEVAGRGWAKARAVTLYTQALELVPEDDPELKRSIVKKQAVATVASFHIRDVERDRRREQPAVDD
jgi:predicted ATPase